MPLSTDTLKTEIRDDLKEYQDYSTTAAGYLERQLIVAGKWLFNEYPWDFVIKQGVITGVSGTLGPYSLAGITDFDTLVQERRITKYYAYDVGAIDPPIQDGTYGRRYEVVLKHFNGTAVLYFLSDPGDGAKVFTYRKKFTFANMAIDWPDDEEIKDGLRTYTAYMCLRNTPDWAQEAANYKTQAEELLKKLKLKKRAGVTRQDTRDPQDVWGQSIYQNFAGDVDSGYNN